MVGGAPKSEDDKTLYALGMIIGRNLADFNLTPRELDIVKAGMTDTVEKKKPAVDLETYGPKVDKLHGDAGRRARRRRRSRARRLSRPRPRARRREDRVGRDRADHQAGHRRDAAADRQVQVHYTGKLIDGTVFDTLAQARWPAGRRFRSTASSSAGPRASDA